MPRDLYETPAWVTQALVPHLKALVPCPRKIWEPAVGSGKMADVLREHFAVVATDAHTGVDFLWATKTTATCIVTNPPFTEAQKFVEKALALTQPNGGRVAMLLASDYDFASTRTHLFKDCRAFAKKINLLKRIVWFQRKGAAPSSNHAWYLWDWQHVGPPQLAYEPTILG